MPIDNFVACGADAVNRSFGMNKQLVERKAIASRCLTYSVVFGAAKEKEFKTQMKSLTVAKTGCLILATIPQDVQDNKTTQENDEEVNSPKSVLHQ